MGFPTTLTPGACAGGRGLSEAGFPAALARGAAAAWPRARTACDREREVSPPRCAGCLLCCLGVLEPEVAMITLSGRMSDERSFFPLPLPLRR